jgi:hypothetical protein
MRQIIAVLPVHTASQLSVFEKEMGVLTAGFSLRRSISYNTFRMSVLQYHQTGVVSDIKCILTHNHFISTINGIATLYRNIDEEDLVVYDDTVMDEPSNDGSTKRMKHGFVDESSKHGPMKRVKHCNVSE